MHIITGPARTTRPGEHHIDATVLPNPHDVPKLRPRNGQDPMVRCWILDQPETQELLLRETTHILDSQPGLITVTCSAGWHRSVAVGDELARRLSAHGIDLDVEHQGIEQRATKANPNRRDDGMGWRHQKIRKRLIANLKEGEPCWWCGRPMHRVHVLHADHSISRKNGGGDADRLLHGACNEQRLDGKNDHRRPALGGPQAFPMKQIRLKAGGVDELFPVGTVEPQETPPADGNAFTWG